MIMPAGTPLLLPVNPRFIVLSLFLALVLQMALGLSGQYWLPDMLALTLACWSVHQPRRVGMGVAFVLGLVMDVHESALLGQNALSYALLSFLALQIYRRLQGFTPIEQALQLLPVMLLVAVVECLVRLLVGDGWPHWSQWLAPFLSALLWPVAGWLLLAPQRRAYDPDDIRPL
ncbi:MAG: rod shape-determining protein MreD [Limnohabitans sp.]